ncbi:MAG: YkvA family protein [Chloroflexota bacterium]|nr:YkvA family protein [Chloroflexota bacterium]
MLKFLGPRLPLLRLLLRHGRLAWRLTRDPRTPVLPKLILAAAIVYALSPLDLVPDVVPLLGQLDDVAIVTLGLELFLKNVPPWLRLEHEAALSRSAG